MFQNTVARMATVIAMGISIMSMATTMAYTPDTRTARSTKLHTPNTTNATVISGLLIMSMISFLFCVWRGEPLCNSPHDVGICKRDWRARKHDGYFIL